ncbi:MAG: hypothetical protein CVU55_12000 [Deltaproteobacteria bacterium HGW-Deltaproteobacteria-13]|jgi:hypothetical protein|nr:MAG: hypothetical protein CVU55_12000 [Deltaproteobacteria bacterium HGW-Deltaproteobacteria-13]
MNKKLLDAIVANGNEYCRLYLSKYDISVLHEDWWQSFDFFLSRACFQGRRDDVSARVYENACKVLSPLFASTEKDYNYQDQKQRNWDSIKTDLGNRIGKGKVGKARDVEMIISALSFLDGIPDKNIVRYSVSKIRDGQIYQHYNDLQAANKNGGIVQVGPKIAAFYLRDVVSVFHLVDGVDAISAFCLQPVDTWVQKIAEKIGIVSEGTDKAEVQKAIVCMCEQESIPALLFNQGAWFTGYHAFDLVLGLMSK